MEDGALQSSFARGGTVASSDQDGSDIVGKPFSSCIASTRWRHLNLTRPTLRPLRAHTWELAGPSMLTPGSPRIGIINCDLMKSQVQTLVKKKLK